MRFLIFCLPFLVSAYDNTKMLCLVNQERVAAGLEPLGLDSRLTASSQQHCDDQASMNSMTHDGSDGSQPGDRVQSSGYSWQTVAENVAYGYGDEEECMKQWMESPGHRENILGPYTQFGSAVAYSGSTPYYTQDFASGDGGSGSFPVCPNGADGGDNSAGAAPQQQQRTQNYQPEQQQEQPTNEAQDGGDDGAGAAPQQQQRTQNYQPEQQQEQPTYEAEQPQGMQASSNQHHHGHGNRSGNHGHNNDNDNDDGNRHGNSGNNRQHGRHGGRSQKAY